MRYQCFLKISAYGLLCCLISEPRGLADPSGSSQSVATGYSGAICTAPESDCNRCVPNVVASFNSISGNFAPAAFHFGTTFRYMSDPSNFYHNEGIVRLPNGGGTYFAVSRLNQGGYSEVSIANFASRASFGAGSQASTSRTPRNGRARRS